jgi:ATP-dependent RNA helicase SUPV3L1/SUV3
MAPRERANKEPDPNSPFAKLAALREQLEADAKGRR